MLMVLWRIFAVLILGFQNSHGFYQNKDCGVFNRGSVQYTRIINGYDVGYYKYPWFAAIQYGDNIFCGGSLITKRHVLSAGHCFKAFPFRNPKNYLVNLGNINTCEMDKSAVKVYPVEKIIIHEKYQESGVTIYFDIAIIVLNKTTEGFMPICLPNRFVTPSLYSGEGNVIGYGLLEYGKKDVPCTLQETRVLIYPNRACRDLMRTAEQSNSVNCSQLNSVICAGYMTGKFDACEGDSGGPLQVLGPNNQIYLAGIVSFGFGCADPNVLGVYTNVTNMMSWISEQLKHEHPVPAFDVNKAMFEYLKWFQNYLSFYYS